MRLTARLLRRRRKSWSQPSFWESEQKLPFWGAGWTAEESVGDEYLAYVHQVYKQSGVIFACVLNRQLVFSEARFQWCRYEDGRRGELHDGPGLDILRTPWPGGTTGDLLARMEADVSLAGNSFLTTVAGRISRLRPDRVTIVIDAPSGDVAAPDARVVGYRYDPPGSNGEPWLYRPDEMCHYAPIPDPDFRFRGMSWLAPVIREIQSDQAATDHKRKFFRHGGTPRMAVKFSENTDEAEFQRFVELWRDGQEGANNAYKTLFLAGGADVTTVGADLNQLDFKSVQGAGETRIAAAAGIPPIIAGFSEGLESATYSNYAQARRRFADGTIRPLWRIAAASLETLVKPPVGSCLWFDDRDIAFLREDQKDQAEIQDMQAAQIRTLIDGGFEADAAVVAVTSGDFMRLTGQHSGLLPVQLQPPGSGQMGNAPDEDDQGDDYEQPKIRRIRRLRGHN